MGADISREQIEEVQKQLGSQSQPPQEPEPEPEPQPRQQPPPPSPPQQQKQHQHALPQEGTSRDNAWLLPPPNNNNNNNNNAKAVENNAAVVKPNSKEVMNFPHNYEYILKDADSPVDASSRETLFHQLYAGVFLDHKTKKYWVEKKSNSNCFMLYAKALSIVWAENPQYWKWVPQKEASGTITEVAELKRVCWLEVNGKFDTRKLTPRILYEVSFIVMLKDPAQGWEVPVNVKLALPGGKKQQHKENLIEKLRVRWLEIPVGEFVASEKHAGEMEFSMYEFEGGMWKQGLVVKGAAIKPKELS